MTIACSGYRRRDLLVHHLLRGLVPWVEQACQKAVEGRCLNYCPRLVFCINVSLLQVFFVILGYASICGILFITHWAKLFSKTLHSNTVIWPMTCIAIYWCFICQVLTECPWSNHGIYVNFMTRENLFSQTTWWNLMETIIEPKKFLIVLRWNKWAFQPTFCLLIMNWIGKIDEDCSCHPQSYIFDMGGWVMAESLHLVMDQWTSWESSIC